MRKTFFLLGEKDVMNDLRREIQIDFNSYLEDACKSPASATSGGEEQQEHVAKNIIAQPRYISEDSTGTPSQKSEPVQTTPVDRNDDKIDDLSSEREEFLLDFGTGEIHLVKRDLVVGRTSKFAKFQVEKVETIRVYEMEKLIEEAWVIHIIHCDGIRTSFLLKQDEKDYKTIIKKFTDNDCVFVSKRKVISQGELMINYLNVKIRNGKIIDIPRTAGWRLRKDFIGFYARNSLGVDVSIEYRFLKELGLPIAEKALVVSGKKETTRTLERYWEQLSALPKQAAVLCSLWLHFALLMCIIFHRFRTLPQRVLCIKVKDFNLASMIYTIFMQVFNTRAPEKMTLEQKNSDFEERITMYKDEILPITMKKTDKNAYKKKLRADNLEYLMSFVVDDHCTSDNQYLFFAPLLFVEKFFDDFPDEKLLKVVLSEAEVNTERLRKMIQKPEIMGDYVAMFTAYIQSNFEGICQTLDNIAEYGTEDDETKVWQGIYYIVRKFLHQNGIDIHKYWGKRDEFLETVGGCYGENSVDYTELAPEIFRNAFRELLSEMDVVDRRVATGYQPKNELVYEDKDVLCFTREILLRIYENEFSDEFGLIEEVLDILEKTGMLETDSSKGTFLKSIYFPKFKSPDGSGKADIKYKKHKMYAVRKEFIYETGE